MPAGSSEENNEGTPLSKLRAFRAPQRSPAGSLVVERFARLVGITTITPRYGAYLYLIAGALVGGGASWLFSPQFSLTGTDTLRPWWVTYHGSLVVGLYLTMQLRDWYQQGIEKLQVPPAVRNRFFPMTPPWIRYGIYVAGLALHFGHYVGFGEIAAVYAFEGVVSGSIKYLIIIPFVYLPVVADILATFVGIHVILPYRVHDEAIDLDFADTINLHGLRPVGQLIKRGTQTYFVALLLFTLFFLRKALPIEEITGGRLAQTGGAYARPSDMLFFYLFLAWVLGIVFFVVPVVWVHRYMRHQKQQALEQLQSDIDDSAIRLKDVTTRPDNRQEFFDSVYLYTALDRVENGHEYPVDYRVLRRVLLVGLLPLAINLITYVLTTFVLPG